MFKSDLVLDLGRLAARLATAAARSLYCSIKPDATDATSPLYVLKAYTPPDGALFHPLDPVDAEVLSQFKRALAASLWAQVRYLLMYRHLVRSHTSMSTPSGSEVGLCMGQREYLAFILHSLSALHSNRFPQSSVSSRFLQLVC